METLSFEYSGSEAFEMLKTYYPDSWSSEIYEAQKFLRYLMKTTGLCPIGAYQKYISYSFEAEKAIKLLAALHIINAQNTYNPKIKKLQAIHLSVENQLLALKHLNLLCPEDKTTLEQYYMSKLKELEKKIDVLMKNAPAASLKIVLQKLSVFKFLVITNGP